MSDTAGVSESKRWVREDPRSSRRVFQKPFDECPHCGCYKYTSHKWFTGILFIKEEQWDECRECGYSPNHPRR